MPALVRIDDLREGDILLYRGTSFISKAIQFFDGTDVSHASVYIGGGKVGEAVAEGLVESDVRDSIAHNEWVKAYRLTTPVDDMTPVLDRARHYLDQGNRYGYEQLLMLGVLCTTRKLAITPILRRTLRTLLDAATATLTEMVSRNKQPMICSEFAFRVYDEAEEGLEDPYTIDIPGLLLFDPEDDARAARALMPEAAGPRVHPESLAALFATPASRAWLQPAERALEPAAVERSLEPRSELDILLEAYLDEAQRARVGIEDLQAATDRFALSLYGADESAEGARFAFDDPAAERSAAYQHLFQVAADFVTPGDLYTTASLQLVGTVLI